MTMQEQWTLNKRYMMIYDDMVERGGALDGTPYIYLFRLMTM